MSYELQFHPKALKEWSKLDANIKEQFKKKLSERLENPIVVKDRLSGFDDIYKIKLRSSGYRLAYKVLQKEIIVLVLKIGKRDNVYRLLSKMISKN